MEFVITAVFIFIVFFILRIFGAWMFRINDVIDYQKDILAELKKLNENKTN